MLAFNPIMTIKRTLIVSKTLSALKILSRSFLLETVNLISHCSHVIPWPIIPLPIVYNTSGISHEHFDEFY